MLVLRILINNVNTCQMFEFFEEGVQGHIMAEVVILEICLGLCMVHNWICFGMLAAHYARTLAKGGFGIKIGKIFTYFYQLVPLFHRLVVHLNDLA